MLRWGTIRRMSDLIVVHNLSKVFGLRPALRDVSFSVAGGQIVSLLGPNGSGKTTLLRLLSALSRATTGTITIGGWSLPDEAEAVRAQLGVVAHLPLLYDDLTARENLAFFGRLYNLPNTADRVQARLEQVGLAKRSGELVRTFSRGMQQRLAIARALLHDPAVLLLDEPYTGLDVAGSALLDSLLSGWKAAQHTVVISTHDLQRATISDRVLILSRGRLVADRPTSDLDNLPALFNQATEQVAL